MKKFLLSILGATAFFCSEAQLYLNELYVRPNLNKGNHEYFELVNLGIAPENADCYTLVTYFNEGGKVKGFYVVDFPSVSVPAQGFLVASSVAPSFQYQLGTGTAQFSWNGGNTNRYVVQGGSLVLNNTGADYENIFYNKAQNSNGESQVYTAFLFKNGALVDAFLGGQKGIVVPSEITQLGTLVAGAGCSAIAYNFSNINNEDDSKFGSVTASAGTDNGYYRCGTGPCPEELGDWQKASSVHEHTPGEPNTNKHCKGGKDDGDDDDSDGDDDDSDGGDPTETSTPGGCTASNGCFQFKLSNVSVNGGDVTLTYVVKTNCAYDLSNVAFQLPAGVRATSYSSSLGTSGVENGTNNPFWAIKFNTNNGGKNGAEATFSYTIPLAALATMTAQQVQAKAGQQIGSVRFTPADCSGHSGGGGDDGDDDDSDSDDDDSDGDGDDDEGDHDGDDDDSDGDDDDSDGDGDDDDGGHDGDDDDSDGDGDHDGDDDDGDSDGDDDDSDGGHDGDDNGNGDGGGNGSAYVIDFGCTPNVFSFSVAGGSYPATVRLYADDGDGVLEATDPLRGSVVMTEPGTGSIMKLPTDEILIMTVDGPGACDDLIEIIAECPADIILPVAFKSFAASRKDNSVGLNWTTATEINNKGFNVERLIGRGDWEVVGFVTSKALNGNSTTDISYNFTDVNPTRSTTIYRLRQVDNDGRIKYSETRQVRGNGENARTLVYPNPSSNGSVTIVFEEANISRNVMVSDMNGRMIQQWRNISNNSVKVDNLMPGMYLVRITDLQTGAQVSEKILVNKR